MSRGNSFGRVETVNNDVSVYGTLDIRSTLKKGGTALTATAAELNSLASGTAIKKITKTVGVASFTDGGSTSGTYALTTAIPVSATVLCSKVLAVTGFAGDTTAVMTIGDGSDVDRYNTSTINVFTTASAGVATGAVSGIAYHAVAATVTLTITGGADFTSIVTNGLGSVTVEIDYIP